MRFNNRGKVQEEVKENESSKHLEALHKKKERIFRTASAGAEERGAAALPPPALPAPGACLDVYVAMAANPWNFVVSPRVPYTQHWLTPNRPLPSVDTILQFNKYVNNY